jgi:hypothetical protein
LPLRIERSNLNLESSNVAGSDVEERPFRAAFGLTSRAPFRAGGRFSATGRAHRG